MRKPVAADGAETQPRRTRRRIALMAILLSAVAVGALVAYAALQPPPPLHLLDVSFSPDPAPPGQPITVTAHAQGGSFFAPLAVMVYYRSFFANAVSGGGTLFSRGGGTYSDTIGPFPNGTAVWIVVLASDGHTFQLSDSYTLEVGDVPHGGPSGLRLNSVLLDPPHPTSLDLPVITVNVTSAAQIADAFYSSIFFFASSGYTSSGGASGSMMTNAQGNYSSVALFGMHGGFGGVGTTVGTVWLYRVGATDSTGNTVLSPAYNFTVASPGG